MLAVGSNCSHVTVTADITDHILQPHTVWVKEIVPIYLWHKTRVNCCESH